LKKLLVKDTSRDKQPEQLQQQNQRKKKH